MRYIVLMVTVLMLTACGSKGGGGGGSSAPTPDWHRIAGTWKATCTASSGIYGPVGTVTYFDVSNDGHMSGLGQTGTTLLIYHDPATFSGYRPTAVHDTEQLDFRLDAVPKQAKTDQINGHATWTIEPITAPG